MRVRGEGWEVTDVIHFDKDEQVRLELKRLDNDNQDTEWFTFEANDEIEEG